MISVHSAVLANDMALAQMLLARPTTDVNQRDDSGCTALFVAIHEGHSDLVALLLSEKGVDVNLANSDGHAPLYHAVKLGHAFITEALLADSRIDVNVRSKCGYTPLWMAMQARPLRTAIVSALLTTRGIDVNPVDIYGHTPLLLAAKTGRTEAVAELLTAPHIDANKANSNDKQTPLHVAVAGGHTEVVAALLAVPGVDVNLLDKHGCSPLYLAAKEGPVQIVSTLIADDRTEVNKSSNSGYTPLYMACDSGRLGVVAVLLSARTIDVNQANVDGRTPLHAAAAEGHGAVVDQLLAMPGIDATKADARGQTALQTAAECGYDAIADALQAATEHNDAPSATETVEEFAVLRELLAGGLHASVISASLQRAKLLLVGRGRSGKSSTLQALKKGRAFDQRERSTAAARQDTLAVFAQEDVQAQEWTEYKPIGQERQRVCFLCTVRLVCQTWPPARWPASISALAPLAGLSCLLLTCRTFLLAHCHHNRCTPLGTFGTLDRLGATFAGAWSSNCTPHTQHCILYRC